MSKSKTQKPAEIVESAEISEEEIRVAAYYNWQRSTGGNTVDEERTRNFWLEAEQDFKPQN